MNLLTKEFETSKCRLLAINLPEGARLYFLYNNPDKMAFLSYNIGIETNRYYLPPGDWEILNVTEEKAREVVDSKHLVSDCACEYCGFDFEVYRDYIDQSEEDWNKYPSADGFRNALESIESLIKSEIKTVNKYGEKPAEDDYSFFTDVNMTLKEAWQAEQATVFDNYIILISKK